jgi:hypothetical protein
MIVDFEIFATKIVETMSVWVEQNVFKQRKCQVSMDNEDGRSKQTECGNNHSSIEQFRIIDGATFVF